LESEQSYQNRFDEVELYYSTTLKPHKNEVEMERLLKENGLAWEDLLPKSISKNSKL
jgi:hypothetical protein